MMTMSITTTNNGVIELEIPCAFENPETCQGSGDDNCEYVCCGSQCRVNGEQGDYCFGDSGDYTCCM